MNDRPAYGTMKWRLYQYMEALKAKRGHNYQYLTNDLYEKLTSRNYIRYMFKKNNIEIDYTYSEGEAQDIVQQLRKENNYARIICDGNQLRIKTFTIWYKKK